MVTKISAIIEAYLLKENRLIIPEVGTLLKRKESGEIVFVEMLKKNDGRLVGLVAQNFGLSNEEAEAIVEGYSEEIGRQLAANRKFIIDGVGVLLVGTSGALEFAFNPFSHTIPAPEPQNHPEQAAPQEVPQPRTEQPKVEETKERPIVVENVAVVGNNDVELMVEEFDDEEDEAEQQVETTKAADESEWKPKIAPSWRKQRVLYDDEDDRAEKSDDEGAPHKRIHISRNRKPMRIDAITIVAIVAVLLAVASLVWGMIPNSEKLDVDAQTEMLEMGEDFVLEEK